MSKSPIEWTDSTWNPIVGCSIVSPGCTNCYAMKMAARIEAMSETNYDRGKSVPLQYAGTTKKVNGNAIWTGQIAQAPRETLLAPLKRKKPTTYFVNSMGDLFHEDCPDAWMDEVFAVMALSPQHDYQVLTKRAGRMRSYMTDPERKRAIAAHAMPISCALAAEGGHRARIKLDHFSACFAGSGPFPNVWLGVSTERQQEADERIPLLLQTPAAVRFVSAEPLLGPIDLTSIRGAFRGGAEDRPTVRERIDSLRGSDRREHLRQDGTWNHRRIDDPDGDPSWSGNCYPRLDWVIVGGESGPNARPMHPDWARSLRDQCTAAGVAFFFKQWGEHWPAEFRAHGPEGEVWRTSPTGNNAWFFDECGAHSPAPVRFSPIGKKKAGRLLDGIEHNAMPERCP